MNDSSVCIYMAVYSFVSFVALGLVVMRFALGRRGFYSSGADYFQAFIKDCIKSIEYAKRGEKAFKIILFLMLLSIIICISSIICMNIQ